MNAAERKHLKKRLRDNAKKLANSEYSTVGLSWYEWREVAVFYSQSLPFYVDSREHQIMFYLLAAEGI